MNDWPITTSCYPARGFCDVELITFGTYPSFGISAARFFYPDLLAAFSFSVADLAAYVPVIGTVRIDRPELPAREFVEGKL